MSTELNNNNNKWMFSICHHNVKVTSSSSIKSKWYQTIHQYYDEKVWIESYKLYKTWKGATIKLIMIKKMQS
jgi:hypothetical protein